MIEGYTEQFVGRRREQKQLLSALRDGSLQSVIITGLGGSGKSSLATRLAWKLKGDGFTPIAVPSSREKTLSEARLIQIFGDAFLAADLDDAFQKLNSPQIPVDARLRYAVGILNKNRFLLVLDNFESNMDEAKARRSCGKAPPFRRAIPRADAGSPPALRRNAPVPRPDPKGPPGDLAR
jgi:AAA+ ATPase superfamily predicted ATPase